MAEKIKQTTVELVDHLPEKIVRIVPIPRPNYWKNLVGESLPEPFQYEGTSKSFDLPKDLKTGRYKKIFDDIKKNFSKQFPDEALTELEAFSRMIGKDLNYNRMDGNFWRGDSPTSDPTKAEKPYRVFVPREGMTLNLSIPEDNLKYRVLKANTDRVAPNWEERDYMPNYTYAIVDENVSIDRKKEQNKTEILAISEFSKIQDNRELLAEFLIAKDPTISIAKSASTDFLFNQVFNVVKNDPKFFLTVMNDEYWKDKVFIYKAVKAGALIKTAKDKYATVGGEEIGRLADVIHYLNDPEKIEFRKRVEHQIKEHNITL